MRADVAVPRDTFAAACRALGATATADELDAVAADLLDRWAQPHRAYHDLEHLTEVLARLDDLGAAGPAPVLAAWFHDAVYEGAPGVDERASAALATTALGRLGVDEAATARVGRLVLATIAHDASTARDDPERAALLDADLAVLASEPERYRRYVQGVRSEYAHLDDHTFTTGRLAVLEQLVGRPTLFVSDAGRTAWEHRARTQVGAEIGELRMRLGQLET